MMNKNIYAKAQTGIYKGKVNDDGILEFLGIRYAKTPKRWKAAEKLDSSEEIIDAESYGDVCCQVTVEEEFPVKPVMSEDCLTLNVWTGSLEGKKPVYVWIHGGCFQTGSNHMDCFGGVYCGDRFVRDNPGIVYVNINYRVGVLGSINLSELDKDGDYADSMNLNVLDQTRALEWVHENIAAFGGDPERVTVGGQSAGSFSVFTLLGMPEARSYFQQAICESSAPTNKIMKSIEIGKACGKKFIELSGAASIQALLDMSVEKVVALGDEMMMSGFRTAFEPCHDGKTVPLDIEASWKSGALKGKRILSGTVSGEYDQMVMDMQPDEIIELVKRRFPALTDDQVGTFIQNDPSRDEKIALMDMFNDIGLRGRHIVATESVIEGGAEGYVYYITSRPKGAKLRTQHCYEIPMVTGKQDSGIYLDFRAGERLHGEEPDYELGKKVQRCWANFIMNGDPNNELLGIKWPEYTLDEKQTMVIDSEWQVVNEVRPKDMAIARKFQ